MTERKILGPWQVLRQQVVYGDPWTRVRKDDVVRPDGQRGTYTVVHVKPGVCVLAMDDDGHVFLTEEYHYGVERVTIEAVSGGVERSEDPLATAQRELREELGIIADEWIPLGVCDPFTANVVSPTQLYLARQLTFGQQDPEGTELIRCVRMTLQEAAEQVLDSQITHAPSCLTILKTMWLTGGGRMAGMHRVGA